MNAIAINIQGRRIQDDVVQTVDARELHDFLEVKSQFRDWIKNRIRDFGFTEGEDFTTTIENYRGGERKDYHLTLDMAKELSMVERNEKGREARQYFIDCERRAKAGPVDPMKILNDPAALRGLLTTYSEKVLTLEKANAEMAPKAEALDRIATADGSWCITDAAKLLQIRPKDLFSWLRQHGWIYTRFGTSGEIAYQTCLADGRLEHKVTTVYRSDGTERTCTQIRVTPKGLAKLAEKVPGARKATH